MADGLRGATTLRISISILIASQRSGQISLFFSQLHFTPLQIDIRKFLVLIHFWSFERLQFPLEFMGDLWELAACWASSSWKELEYCDQTFWSKFISVSILASPILLSVCQKETLNFDRKLIFMFLHFFVLFSRISLCLLYIHILRIFIFHSAAHPRSLLQILEDFHKQFASARSLLVPFKCHYYCQFSFSEITDVMC